MDYQAVLATVLALLQQEQRLSYRVLKLRLQLDDDTLEALKEDLIYAKKLAVDEEGRVLVWAGGADQSLSSLPSSTCRCSSKRVGPRRTNAVGFDRQLVTMPPSTCQT